MEVVRLEDFPWCTRPGAPLILRLSVAFRLLRLLALVAQIHCGSYEFRVSTTEHQCGS